MAVPILLLLLHVPSRIALPIIAVTAIGGTIYGCYWTMRIIHGDRGEA